MILAKLPFAATPLRRAYLIIALSGSTMALAGCRPALPTVAVIPRTCGTLLWEAEHTGVERTASGYALNVYWNAPMRDDDVQGQIEILKRALDHGAKGLIVSP